MSSSRRLGACPRRGAFASLSKAGVLRPVRSLCRFLSHGREQIDRVRAWFRDWHREQFGGTSSRGN